jgi:HEAT repeat protein
MDELPPEHYITEQQIVGYIDQLGAEDPESHGLASEGLRKLGVAAIPYLINALHSEERWYRSVETLVRIGLPAIGPLIMTLDTPAVNFAADALFKIGPPAVPALIQALRHESVAIRDWAALILGWIGDERAIPALQEALTDSDQNVRNSTQAALDQLHDRKL